MLFRSVSKGLIFFNMLAMTENPWSSFEFHVEKTVAGWVWVILFYLIVDGGWVWVILGLCWVCERILERSGKEIIKNVKRINILLNKCVE